MLKRLFAWFKTLCLLAWVALVILVGTKLALDNQELVAVQFFGFTKTLNSGLLMALILILGVFLGAFSVLAALWFERIRARRLNKKLNRAQKELDNLRVAPLKAR